MSIRHNEKPGKESYGDGEIVSFDASFSFKEDVAKVIAALDVLATILPSASARGESAQ